MTPDQSRERYPPAPLIASRRRRVCSEAIGLARAPAAPTPRPPYLRRSVATCLADTACPCSPTLTDIAGHGADLSVVELPGKACRAQRGRPSWRRSRTRALTDNPHDDGGRIPEMQRSVPLQRPPSAAVDGQVWSAHAKSGRSLRGWIRVSITSLKIQCSPRLFATFRLENLCKRMNSTMIVRFRSAVSEGGQSCFEAARRCPPRCPSRTRCGLR